MKCGNVMVMHDEMERDPEGSALRPNVQLRIAESVEECQ